MRAEQLPFKVRATRQFVGRFQSGMFVVGFLLFGSCGGGLASAPSKHVAHLPAGKGDAVPPGDLGDDEPSRPPSLARLQQAMMDFSDRYISAVWGALDAYIAAEPDVSKQVQAQRLKVALATTSMTIAASKDPRANILDMAVFISAGKWAVDHYWIPKVFGEKADGLRMVYGDSDAEIWAEVDHVLTPAQSADLRSLIAAWREGNPGPGEVMDVRLRNLDGVVLNHFDEAASAKGLLANVRRWLGNVDQSLLYGERMLFYLERTPLVLEQQSDLTVDRVAERFPIATIKPDFDQWSGVANTLPKQIGDMLQAREQVVREVMPQIRDSLGSVDHITHSLQQTVDSADALAAKVQKLPFKQEDYAVAMDRTAASLDKVNEVIIGLNRLLDEDAAGGKESHAAELARLLDERTDKAMDNLFQRIEILIGMVIGGLILVLIVARLLFRPAQVTISAPKIS